MEGEAALYGPKIDFMFKDSLGNERQLATIQLDFSMPKRFGLEYTDEKGQKKTPVMIHRAILGSYERFLAILIEHYAGAFPVWLAPVQVRVITVSDTLDMLAYALNNVCKPLYDKGIRVQLNHKDFVSDMINVELTKTDIDEYTQNETVGKKIREAELQKIPYMIVIGEKEMKSKKIAVRSLKSREIKEYKLETFIEKINSERI